VKVLARLSPPVTSVVKKLCSVVLYRRLRPVPLTWMRPTFWSACHHADAAELVRVVGWFMWRLQDITLYQLRRMIVLSPN